MLGAAFCFLGALGVARMPDVYNRIQAGTKAVTLGSLSLLIGVGLRYPAWWAKLVSIAGFILFTNPVGSSTIARALHRAGVPLGGSRSAADESGLVVMLAAAVAAVTLPNPLAAVAAGSVVSLATSVAFALLLAPDVALPEAAVGAGISALVLALGLKRLGLRRLDPQGDAPEGLT